jgi:hypothetical protein
VISDQLPFGPHSDAIGWEERVENLESQRRGQFEISVLHCEADGGGAIADHADADADVRCGGDGDEFGKARARVFGPRGSGEQRCRQRIAVQLRKNQ